MHPIHRILYDSIVESAILHYYRQTDYYQRREAQAQWEEHLQKRLSPSLLADLESFQLAVSRTQDAELEAMFLAGLDCGLMLSCGLQPFPRLVQK